MRLRATETSLSGRTESGRDRSRRFQQSTFGGNATVENNLINLSANESQDYPDSAEIAGINVQDFGSNTIADNVIGGTYQGIDICNSPNNTVTSNVIGSNTASLGGPDFGVIDQGISIENGLVSSRTRPLRPATSSAATPPTATRSSAPS